MAAIVLSMDDEYDISKLIKFNRIPVWRRMLLRLMVPIQLVRLFHQLALQRIHKNVFHDGKRNSFTGEKKIAFSKTYKLDEIKKSAHALGQTVNDFMVAALSMSVKRYHVLKGDTKTNKMDICIPANIRWEHYQTRDDVKLENKFAPVALQIPLCADAETAMEKIKPVTR